MKIFCELSSEEIYRMKPVFFNIETVVTVETLELYGILLGLALIRKISREGT